MSKEMGGFGLFQKFLILSAGGITGILPIYYLYDPNRELKDGIKSGKRRLLDEYDPRYNELRRQLIEELEKSNAKT